MANVEVVRGVFAVFRAVIARSRVAVPALALACVTGVASAQAPATPPGAEAPPAADAAEPPVLLEAAAPTYPASELGTGGEPTVGLRLTIDATGNIAEVEVTESAGPAFDEAAREAALRTRFSPARRGGEAVASRILYRIEFRRPAAAEPERTEPAPADPVAVGAATLLTPVEPAAPPPAHAAQDVAVYGESRADRRRRSAEAVTVVELEQAQRESSDLGEVLARTEGVGVRRSGGLGSSTRFSLNGLTDDQIHFFLDGIPLELQGYTFGLGNVPVNLIDHVEIYAGVVPVRYGADALGGAVDLRTDPAVHGTHGSASYEVGSFGTQRITASGRHRFDPSGFFVNLNGFFDYARNDYFVDDVLVADATGAERPVRARRFHDDYRAAGGNAELGFVDRPWAKRLVLRGFITDFAQDIQSNPPMTIAYGGITYEERAAGVSLRYENPLGRGVSLRAVTGYSYQKGHFVDVDPCAWSWLGECQMQTLPGETDNEPHDQVNDDHSYFGRYELELVPGAGHALRIAAAPTYFSRTGDERYDQPDEIDELNSIRRMLSFVGGVEYELDAFDERVENIAFAKLYVQRVEAEEVVPGGTLPREENRLRAGAGDAFRFRLTESLYAKISYEFATRLPSPEETFGNNVFVRQQFEDLLRPETSHNANLSLALDVPARSLGAVRGAVNGFVRNIRDLIAHLAFARGTAYINVANARALGVEAVTGWTSPGKYVALDANATYLHFTNVSETGPFRDYQGDRLPNRPYLFANATARFQLTDLLGAGDELSLASHTRYVHSFWLGWESIGSEESRRRVPSQVVETLALSYLRRFADTTATATLEAQNVGDAQVYDYFGSQRPGRAYYLKLTLEH